MSAGGPSGSLLSVRPISRDALHLYIYRRDFNETWHKYSACEWELMKRFTRSDIKGQGNIATPTEV